MHKEYLYNNGQVIINDENGFEKVEEYYDNIDKVLALENVIEEATKEYNNLVVYADRQITNKGIIRDVSLFMGVCTLFHFLISRFLVSNGDEIIDSGLGRMPLSEIVAIATIPGVFSGWVFCCFYIFNQINAMKSIKGKKAQLEFLKQFLLETNAELEHLSNNKTKELEDKFKLNMRATTVNDKSDLHSLREKLNLYDDCAYNEKKYQKYYQKGILDKKLGKKYTDYGIEMVKDYIKENNKVKVKK